MPKIRYIEATATDRDSDIRGHSRECKEGA